LVAAAATITDYVKRIVRPRLDAKRLDAEEAAAASRTRASSRSSAHGGEATRPTTPPRRILRGKTLRHLNTHIAERAPVTSQGATSSNTLSAPLLAAAEP
jgi:hypothetical protein